MNDQFNLNFVNCDDTSEYKCNVRNISRDLLKSNLILKVNCLLRQAVRWKNLAIMFVTTEWEQSQSQTYQRPFKGRLRYFLTKVSLETFNFGFKVYFFWSKECCCLFVTVYKKRWVGSQKMSIFIR